MKDKAEAAVEETEFSDSAVGEALDDALARPVYGPEDAVAVPARLLAEVADVLAEEADAAFVAGKDSRGAYLQGLEAQVKP